MDVPLYWQNSPEYVLWHVHLPLLHVPWPPHLLLSQAICIRGKKKKSHNISCSFIKHYYYPCELHYINTLVYKPLHNVALCFIILPLYLDCSGLKCQHKSKRNSLRWQPILQLASTIAVHNDCKWNRQAVKQWHTVYCMGEENIENAWHSWLSLLLTCCHWALSNCCTVLYSSYHRHWGY